MNSTQARTVSFFFLLCVWCSSWVSRERVLLVAPGWGVGCLRSAAAACPHALLRGDPPNLVPPVLGEPDVAIRAGRDALRVAAKSVLTGPWQWEQGGAATGGDAPDAIPKGQGEPQVAIRPGRDAERVAIGRGDGEPGDVALGGDAPDLVRRRGEPQVAIRPGGDAIRTALGRGDGELGDGARCGPGGSSAQAQQADTGDQGGEQCGQV